MNDPTKKDAKKNKKKNRKKGNITSASYQRASTSSAQSHTAHPHRSNPPKNPFLYPCPAPSHPSSHAHGRLDHPHHPLPRRPHSAQRRWRVSAGPPEVTMTTTRVAAVVHCAPTPRPRPRRSQEAWARTSAEATPSPICDALDPTRHHRYRRSRRSSTCSRPTRLAPERPAHWSTQVRVQVQVSVQVTVRAEVLARNSPRASRAPCGRTRWIRYRSLRLPDPRHLASERVTVTPQ